MRCRGIYIYIYIYIYTNICLHADIDVYQRRSDWGMPCSSPMYATHRCIYIYLYIHIYIYTHSYLSIYSCIDMFIFKYKYNRPPS